MVGTDETTDYGVHPIKLKFLLRRIWEFNYVDLRTKLLTKIDDIN